MTTGWKLDRACREALLARHPPRYARTVADHVTLASGKDDGENSAPPPQVAQAAIVGRADDGSGVEAMVVAIDGGLARPDGGTWHVTWSLGEGREARESNDVIAARGWTALPPEAIELVPACW